ncbi:MAG: hypothetical protein ISS25_01070 [Nanoarchaeota archaeon]|nr:hypothetical protein [DPANN group archaeon]MBL7116405.1 hypothetical protein [Nanoarchaeota archaeon]
MEPKECKIVCDGKEIATLTCTEGGFTVKCTEEGKELCREMCKECC